MNEFQKNGFSIVKDFIDPSLCKIALDYIELKSKTTGLVYNQEPNFIPESMTFYADSLTESILKNSLPKMEELTDLKLFPTYSFMRLYKEGDRLPKHKDRLSCQIAVSLCIGYGYDDAEYQWPIYLNGNEIASKPGDALLYHGTEQEHWREPLERDWHLQIFLFYIDQKADYARDLMFDARPDLGLSKETYKFNIRDYEKEYYESRGYEDQGRVTFHD